MKTKQITQKGHSVLEVLLAISIFVVGVMTIGFIFFESSMASRQSVEHTQALFLAKEGLEAVRSIRDYDFDNVAVGVHGLALTSFLWTFSSTFDTTNQFTRTVTVADIDDKTKQVTSRVAWPFTSVRENEVVLTGYVTDWAQTKGDTGDLDVDIASASLSASSTELSGITFENIGANTITLDAITLWWGATPKLTEIEIDNVVVFNSASSSEVVSGEEVDITDVILAQGSGSISINQLKFDGDVTGTDFLITFLMSDSNAKHILVSI